MSITIQKQPQFLQTTYNPMIIVATSSQQSQDGFLMVGDIYARGQYITRMKVATNPDGYCLFDIHKHIENVISYDFNPEGWGFSPATYSSTTYSVHLGEEWRPKWTFFDNYFLLGGKLGFIGLQNDDPTPEFSIGDQILVQQTSPFTFSQYEGSTTIVGIYATSGLSAPYNGNRWIIETDKTWLGSTPIQGGTISLFGFRTFIDDDVINIGNTTSVALQKWAFNGVNTFLEDLTWNYVDYEMITSTASFLTNVPDNYVLRSDSRMWLNFMNSFSTPVDKLWIYADGMTYSIDNSFQSPTLYNQQRILTVGCGPYQLNTYTSSIIPETGSTFPIIKPTTKEYSFFVGDAFSPPNQFSKLMTFKINDKCSKYEKIQMVFMDKLGSFIPFTFNLVSRENKNINRSSYQQHYGQYAPSSQNWTYNTWDRGKKTLDTQITENWTITSDWVNQSTSDFLMTLMESPEVYWIKENGTAIAVSLTVSSTERKQTINDQIINYTITFEISNKNNTQK